MVNMSAKFDKEIWNGVDSIVFTRSTHGWTDGTTHGRTDGTTAALLYPHRDKEIHNSLVSIMFTSLFPYMSILTLTSDFQNQYGSSSHDD